MVSRIAIFPTFVKDNWVFRISISDDTNIMVICIDTMNPTGLMIRFFTDPQDAIGFMTECSAGKHQDENNFGDV